MTSMYCCGCQIQYINIYTGDSAAARLFVVEKLARTTKARALIETLQKRVDFKQCAIKAWRDMMPYLRPQWDRRDCGADYTVFTTAHSSRQQTPAESITNIREPAMGHSRFVHTTRAHFVFKPARAYCCFHYLCNGNLSQLYKEENTPFVLCSPKNQNRTSTLLPKLLLLVVTTRALLSHGFYD